MDRPTIPIQRKLILVVDDHNEFREVLCRSLMIEGYNVLEAADGLAALEKLRERQPDLIISDVNMPRMNGIEFYKALRREPAWLTIPFVLVTSYDAHEDVHAARMLGVEDYLTKPVDHDELIKIINARLLRSAELELAHINQALFETVKVLANSIEGRDSFTSQHVERVVSLARRFARQLKWPDDLIRSLEYGARLHDIGKIIVPDDILNKRGPLSEEEWSLMRHHTVAGARIIKEISHLSGTLPYILYHHEHWDGSGYPQGVAGRDIPLEGRLMALVDTYDALTHDRPYHPARPKDEVIRFLKLKSGEWFDPDLVPIFIEMLQRPEV